MRLAISRRLTPVASRLRRNSLPMLASDANKPLPLHLSQAEKTIANSFRRVNFRSR